MNFVVVVLGIEPKQRKVTQSTKCIPQQDVAPVEPLMGRLRVPSKGRQRGDVS